MAEEKELKNEPLDTIPCEVPAYIEQPNKGSSVKCAKCGWWHKLVEGVGEAIGQAKFGE